MHMAHRIAAGRAIISLPDAHGTASLSLIQKKASRIGPDIIAAGRANLWKSNHIIAAGRANIHR
jgi:hypothetical protein